MYSYGCNATGTTTCVSVNVHNQLNPFTPSSSSSSMKPKINYYNNRRKDIKQLFTPTNVKQHHHHHTHKSTQKSASVNSVDECSHRKKQIMNYEDNKVKKVSEMIQKDKEQMKSNKKQLEEEMKKCKLHNESLSNEVERYKKQIQKLIEDNIKLKNINQEQSILINSSANTSFIAHGFVVKKEIAFTILNNNNNKKKKLYTNVFPLQSKNNITTTTTIHNSNDECSQIEMLINSIEKENDSLSTTITDLESKVDSYILSKLTEQHNNNNNNSSSNSSSNNEINTLLYSFYSKIASLLNKSIIDYASIPLNKKMFIISTSSILTEIKTYQLMLQKTSFHNYLKK